MPTASTSRLIAAQQSKKAAFNNEKQSDQNGTKGGGTLFRRFQRPRSSKYDTYRLRARTSVVEENLFGEPLKNKLMSRSRSMEAIADGLPSEECSGNNEPLQQPTLFTRRNLGVPTSLNNNNDQQKRIERPRTALANMRPPGGSGKLQDPEFEKRCSGQGNFEHKPLVLSRHIFEKIMMAAKVDSQEEKAKKRRDEDIARQAELEACERRKLELQAAAEFHLTTDETEMDRENNTRNHHIIERAQNLRDEQLPEVKKLNELINRAKCHAILDVQIEEKAKRQNEIALSQKMLEEQVETERKQAQEMAFARQERIKQFNKDYRQGLLLQRAEQEAQKLLAQERREIEMELRKKQEEAERIKEAKEVANKREKMRMMKEQVALEIEETRHRKAIEEEQRRLDDQRIEALQTARRNAEISKEQEEKRLKREKEKEMARMKDKIEQEQELLLKREELRILRQQEAEDKKWRKQELEIAQAKVQQEAEIKMILDEQIRQRQENAARSVERDRKYWEDVQKTWHETTEADKAHLEIKAKRKQDYLMDLKSQMAVKESCRHDEKHLAKQEKTSQDSDRKSYQERLNDIREKKLKELRAYNVPEKYLHEIEKKCQQAARAKLTKGFFGLK